MHVWCMIGEDKKDQISKGSEPNPKEEKKKSSLGEDKKDQISEGSESNPKEEQPMSSSGNDKNDQISKGSESDPKKEQPKINTGEDKKDQISEASQSITKEEQSKSSSTEEEQLTAKATEDNAEKILEKLTSGKKTVVILRGDAGTGKTWLAKKITKKAVSTKGSYYMSLWISLKDQDKDYLSLYQSIALQLSIPTTAGVWEDVDDADDWKKEDYAENYFNELSKLKQELKQKLEDKIKEKNREFCEKKIETKHTFLLLVLDSEGVVKKEDYDNIKKELFLSKDATEKLKDPFTEKLQDSFSILITTNINAKCPGLENDAVAGFQPPSGDEVHVFEIQPLSGAEALTLLEESVRKDIWKDTKWKEFCDEIKGRSKVLPAQIIMLAEALSHIAEDGPEALERALDAALDILRPAHKDDPIPLLHFTYEKLPDVRMIDCFWHSWNLLKKHGGVQYNELIAHWILEGHLDLAAGVKTAYEKGYDVMTKLVDRGMLKMQENNLIVLEGATLTLDDHSCRGLLEKSNLGLACMLEDDNRKIFERMAPADGMMKTVSLDKKGEPVCSLLIDGSRLCREIPDTFFETKKNLKVLALFSPRLTSLPESISKMEHLLVLVLRGCYLLNDIERIKNLKELRVLEVSDAPFLKEMSDQLFAGMSKLRSLNLSALGIKSVPLSLSDLTELRRLILRKCSLLEALPKLGKLKKLEVIDLSGCSSLTKIQEKCFQSFEELRFIDFSETKIEKLPIVQGLKNLTILLVKGCDRLYGLRHMKRLPSLKVLDVSGATRIKEIIFDCFDGTDYLRILDLSETKIRFLPNSLSQGLCELKVKDSPKLLQLPSTTALKNLESLDLSGSSLPQKFPDGFFENLTSLQSLNLSNTKFESLPSLSKLGNLRHLLLKGCSLEKLPELKGLTSLVELDLSNCKSSATKLPSLEGLKFLEIIDLSSYNALSEIDPSFAHMSWLRVLDLSETQISSVPSLPNPSKLRSLILNNCTKLQTSPNFEILSQLEELNLSGTSFLKDVKAVESLNCLTGLQKLKLSEIPSEGIKSLRLKNLKQLEVLDLSVVSLPSLDSLSNLRKLVLRGCSSLKELPSLDSLSHLEELDLSGTKVKNLGDKISKLTNLKLLYLPQEVIEEFKEGKNVEVLPLEVKLDRCCISKPSDTPQGDKKPQSKPSDTPQGDEKPQSKPPQGDEKPQSKPSDTPQVDEKPQSNPSDTPQGDEKPQSNQSKPSDIPQGDEKPQSKPFDIPQGDKKPQIIVHGTELVKSLKGNSELLESIRHSISSVHSQSKDEDNYGDSRKYIFSDIYYKIKVPHEAIDKVSLEAIHSQSLEIRGFDDFPADIEVILKHAKYVFLVENNFLKNLSDLKPCSLMNTEGFWLERCTRMESIFMETDPGKWEKLETLWISNLPKVKSLCDEKVESLSFWKVKHLYIDCCPMLETVFSSGQIPENLETLQIKFCDKLKTLVGDKGSAKGQVQTTDSADNRKVQATSSADKKEQIPASAEKEGLAQATIQADKEGQPTTRTNLKNLHISYCPMLETVFSSAQLLPNLENLNILQIKYCDRLKSLYQLELVNTKLPKLLNLHTLHLLELPNWTSSSIWHIVNKSIPNFRVSPNINVEESLPSGNVSKGITGTDEN
ncbi:hypothetical protein DITRI_Ditri04bG0085200 [Diplodiscus trichospermus]